MISATKNEHMGNYHHENDLDDQLINIVGPLV